MLTDEQRAAVLARLMDGSWGWPCGKRALRAAVAAADAAAEAGEDASAAALAEIAEEHAASVAAHAAAKAAACKAAETPEDAERLAAEMGEVTCARASAERIAAMVTAARAVVSGEE